MPNFVIRKFRVPIFLLPIYQAAGIQYGVRWEVLAAINEIETDYGRNLNVSSAGALGWMQFIPSSWRAYGVDANKDGKKDPYNPVDAIFAAGRYLKAAGAEKDLRRAIFAYNHADWYVDSVMLRAKLITGVPADLVGSLTGLTEGRFPVAARARYADVRPAATREPHAASRSSARAGSPAVATADGVVKKIGRSRRLGRYRRAPGRLRQPLHLRHARIAARGCTRCPRTTPSPERLSVPATKAQPRRAPAQARVGRTPGLPPAGEQGQPDGTPGRSRSSGGCSPIPTCPAPASTVAPTRSSRWGCRTGSRRSSTATSLRSGRTRAT